MENLQPTASLLLVIDVQERLAKAMDETAAARLISSVGVLLEASRELGVPVLATEQYPKGLGPTVAPVNEALRDLGVTPVPKLTFDACGEPALARALGSFAPRHVIVVGMETHVCVFQSARELVRRGFSVHVVADAVASRTEENRSRGLALCERAGAVVTVTETVLFDWLERAGTPAFKALAPLVK